jgi:hypothetical protein
MPATKEELNEYNRYEVTAISTSGRSDSQWEFTNH